MQQIRARGKTYGKLILDNIVLDIFMKIGSVKRITVSYKISNSTLQKVQHKFEEV